MNTLFEELGIQEEESGAEFSEDRKHRYALWRIWDRSMPLVMFIGLNPSTANENKNDRTINRVIEFAKTWGYGGVYMMNLFSYVTPYPKDLIKCEDNSENNFALNIAKIDCKDVIFAYGNFDEAKERAIEIHKMFPEGKALVINRNGTPRHPLYVKKSTKPIPFKHGKAY